MRRFAVVLAVVIGAGVAESGAAESGVELDNSTNTLEGSSNQEEPMSCAFQFNPSCLRSLAARLVDKLSRDPHFQPLPGVMLSSDISTTSSGDSLDTVGQRTAAFIRSLTLTVRPLHLELPFLNTSQILENLLTQVTARKKGGGAGGLGGIALMMGGAMMTMMMAGLAAMAGKALMTSLTALMLAAMSAMKGGGGGGDSKTSTYEIVAKPGHSSDHGW